MKKIVSQVLLVVTAFTLVCGFALPSSAIAQSQSNKWVISYDQPDPITKW